MAPDAHRPEQSMSIGTQLELKSISRAWSYNEIRQFTNDFDENKILGSGSYGKVFLSHLKCGTEAAIKQLVNPVSGGFKDEVTILSKLRHKNIVTLLGWGWGDDERANERYLVYELMECDLSSRIGDRNNPLLWNKRVEVLIHATQGLGYLHMNENKIFHRDIKSANILLDKDGNGKVADFGLAKIAEKEDNSAKVKHTSGTVGYACPEYICTSVVCEGSESYSIGMVILEVLTLCPPARNRNNKRGDGVEYMWIPWPDKREQCYNWVTSKCELDPKAEWPRMVVEHLLGIVHQCLQKDPDERPHATQIKQDLEVLRNKPEYIHLLELQKIKDTQRNYENLMNKYKIGVDQSYENHQQMLPIEQQMQQSGYPQQAPPHQMPPQAAPLPPQTPLTSGFQAAMDLKNRATSMEPKSSMVSQTSRSDKMPNYQNQPVSSVGAYSKVIDACDFNQPVIYPQDRRMSNMQTNPTSNRTGSDFSKTRQGFQAALNKPSGPNIYPLATKGSGFQAAPSFKGIPNFITHREPYIDTLSSANGYARTPSAVTRQSGNTGVTSSPVSPPRTLLDESIYHEQNLHDLIECGFEEAHILEMMKKTKKAHDMNLIMNLLVDRNS